MDFDNIETKAQQWLEWTEKRLNVQEVHPWVEPKREDIYSDKLRKYPHQICWIWENPESPTKREFAIVIEWVKTRYARRDEATWDCYPDGEATEDIFFLLWYWLWSENV